MKIPFFPKYALPVLMVMVLIVYYPAFGHDFLFFWDDQWVVMNHYTMGGFNLENIKNIFTEFHGGQYAPLNEMNYLTLYSLFGYDSFAFHLMSLIWHLANVVLVYLFVTELLHILSPENATLNTQIAFFATLLFAIHPVNVESVAWLSASKVLIYSFFYLLALLFYLKYLNKPTIYYYLLVFALFVASSLSKEQAVTLPLCMLLIDCFSKRKLKDKNVWIEKIPFFFYALFIGLLTIKSQGGGEATLAYPLFQRPLLAAYAYFEYFVKCILPIKLSYLYPFPMQPQDDIPLRLWFYPVIILSILFAMYNIKHNRIIMFCVIFFTIHLLPVLHLISLSRFAIVADRYAYLSTVGVAILLVYVFSELCKKCKPLYLKYKILIIIPMLYVLYLGIYANSYNRIWENTDSLKKNFRELLDDKKNNIHINSIHIK